MFSNLLARTTFTLIVFGDFMPYPAAKRVVPQWAVVTLNTPAISLPYKYTTN